MPGFFWLARLKKVSEALGLKYDTSRIEVDGKSCALEKMSRWSGCVSQPWCVLYTWTARFPIDKWTKYKNVKCHIPAVPPDNKLAPIGTHVTTWPNRRNSWSGTKVCALEFKIRLHPPKTCFFTCMRKKLLNIFITYRTCANKRRSWMIAAPKEMPKIGIYYWTLWIRT